MALFVSSLFTHRIIECTGSTPAAPVSSDHTVSPAKVRKLSTGAQAQPGSSGPSYSIPVHRPAAGSTYGGGSVNYGSQYGGSVAPTYQPNRLRTSTQFQDAFASVAGSAVDNHTPRSLTSFEQMDPYIFGNHTNDVYNYENQKTFATRGEYLRQLEGYTVESEVPHLQKQSSVAKSPHQLETAVTLDLGMHLGATTGQTLMQAIRMGGVKFQHKFAGNEFEVDVTLEGGGECTGLGFRVLRVHSRKQT